MNTTMADGAEQRLDAQIAEALFGQPGMSKMDVANRVRELRGDGPALLVPRVMGQADALLREVCAQLEALDCGACIGSHAPMEDLHGRIARHLAAQPSPGGQGDAHDMEDPCDVITRAAQKLSAAGQPRIADRLVRARTEVERLQAAYLAARQPAGQEPNGYFDPDVLAHLTEGLIDPVGVLRRKPNGKSNVPVWLAPPAQAVDLGRFRPAVMTSLGLSSPNSTERETLHELLALIDSLAVGNG